MTTAVATELLQRVDAWREKVAVRELNTATRLNEVKRARENAHAGRLHEPPPVLLTVLLLGATGGGKSELLNALAGARIAQSHYIRPTTSRPTIYAHNEVTAARLYEYGSTLADVAGQPNAFITHDREELRHKILIDAPDIDSYRTEHRETVLRLLPIVDVVLYVVTPFSYKDDIGWQMVLEHHGRRAFAFVMNKWDEEGRPHVSEGTGDVDQDFRAIIQRSGYRDPRIFRTSAKEWVAKKVDGAGSTPDDDLPELERWLASGLATSEVQEIHVRKRRVLWGQLAAAVHRALWPISDEPAAIAALQTQFAALQNDGRRIAAPYWLCHGLIIAREHDATRRPVSPGIIGWILRLFNHGRLFTRKRLKLEIALDDCSAQDPNRWNSTTLATQLQASAERHIANSEWELRQAQVPLAQLEKEWETAASQLASTLQATVDAEMLAVRKRAPRAWRRWLAIALLTITELATIALIGMAGWRIAIGFMDGVYADLAMVLNLVALILFLVLLAGMGLALLFPETQHRVARELDAAFRKIWSDRIAALKAQGEQHVKMVQGLHKEGLELQIACAREAEKLGQELDRGSEADPGEVSRMFASASPSQGDRVSTP